MRLCGPFAWRDRPDFTCFQAGSETAAIARGVAERYAARVGQVEQRETGGRTVVNQLEIEKTLNTSLPFLQRLKGEGRSRAESWLAENGAALGRRSTLDLDRFAA